ncbi:hypothetical protein ACLB2K_059511 [Fragaria x ananassa]
MRTITYPPIATICLDAALLAVTVVVREQRKIDLPQSQRRAPIPTTLSAAIDAYQRGQHKKEETSPQPILLTTSETTLRTWGNPPRATKTLIKVCHAAPALLPLRPLRTSSLHLQIRNRTRVAAVRQPIRTRLKQSNQARQPLKTTKPCSISTKAKPTTLIVLSSHSSSQKREEKPVPIFTPGSKTHPSKKPYMSV